MFSKKVIRVVAIVMAVLMLLGIFGAAISAFAAESVIKTETVIPATGRNLPIPPMIIGGIALLVAIICVILSKKNKNSADSSETDFIDEDEIEKSLMFFKSRKDDAFLEKSETEEEEQTEEIKDSETDESNENE